MCKLLIAVLGNFHLKIPHSFTVIQQKDDCMPHNIFGDNRNTIQFSILFRKGVLSLHKINFNFFSCFNTTRN